MKIWGVTGTNGKTTTTWIFAEFLNADPTRKCGYVTTVEVNTGTRRFYTGYTTPPLRQLREILAEMEANGCTDCVMEVSSHAIHQHRTGDTVFAGGVFTNLSEDHLDYHRTMAAYFDVKLDFARQIAAAHKASPDLGRRDLPPYVVCLDGGYGTEMYHAVGNLAVNVIGVSRKCPSCGYDLRGLQLVGDYNRSNVLCAAALAEAAGVSPATIQAAIPKLKPRWGRLELIENPQVRAKVYVDFAHTPDGLEQMLSAVRAEMTGERSRLWVVFGAGGDRDPMKRPLMGAACARLADRLVVTSDNPRSEDPMQIIEAILTGVDDARGRAPAADGFLHVEPDRRAAIEYALANAVAGDVVVIAGKGHETTQEIGGVKYPFDDREFVRRYSACAPSARVASQVAGSPAGKEGK
ncbi:MAG: Mur ligase family protein [Kiritimatiellia bacterium]